VTLVLNFKLEVSGEQWSSMNFKNTRLLDQPIVAVYHDADMRCTSAGNGTANFIIN